MKVPDKKTYYCPHSNGKTVCVRGRCPHDDCAINNAYEAAARECFAPVEDKPKEGGFLHRLRIAGGC